MKSEEMRREAKKLYKDRLYGDSADIDPVPAHTDKEWGLPLDQYTPLPRAAFGFFGMCLP